MDSRVLFRFLSVRFRTGRRWQNTIKYEKDNWQPGKENDLLQLENVWLFCPIWATFVQNQWISGRFIFYSSSEVYQTQSRISLTRTTYRNYSGPQKLIFMNSIQTEGPSSSLSAKEEQQRLTEWYFRWVSSGLSSAIRESDRLPLHLLLVIARGSISVGGDSRKETRERIK